MRKRHIIFACYFVIFLILAGSTFSYHQKTKTITLELGLFSESNWGVSNGNSYEIIDSAIRKMEKLHKKVKVHYYSGIRKQDYNEWLSEQILLGKTPDVFMICEEQFDQLASRKILKNLEAHVEKNHKVRSWEYFNSAWNSGIYKGTLYALPYEANFMLMAVNKTLLEAHGCFLPSYDWTWDDFYSLCSKMTVDEDGDSIPDIAGVCNYTWKDAVYSNGGRIFDESGKSIYFTDQKVISAVRFIQSLSALSKDRLFTAEDFDNGRVAFMPVNFARYKTYISYPYKITKDLNYEWYCLPMPAGPSGNNISEINTLMMGISSNTKYTKLACEFLEILTHDEEIQTKIAQSIQGTSSLRRIANSKYTKQLLNNNEEGHSSVDIGLPAEIMNKGFSAHHFKEFDQYMAIADNSIQSIIYDKKDAEITLKILQRTLQNTMER